MKRLRICDHNVVDYIRVSGHRFFGKKRLRMTKLRLSGCTVIIYNLFKPLDRNMLSGVFILWQSDKTLLKGEKPQRFKHIHPPISDIINNF